jgi:hypothetical protein
MIIGIRSISSPRRSTTGIVVATPKAIDSPAEPVVCTILFSRIVDLPNSLKRVMESTAMGIEALTVIPTLRARYTEEAAKTIPRIAPIATARNVNSLGLSEAGIKGLKSESDIEHSPDRFIHL